MFGRKTRQIRELVAKLATNDVTIRMQDDTIAVQRKTIESVKAESNADGAKIQDLNALILVKNNEIEVIEEVSHAKDGRLIELQGQVAQQAAQLVHQAQLLKEAQESSQPLHIELAKSLEKIQNLEDELRQEKQRAQSAARASSFGSLHDVNDFPQEEPERKALNYDIVTDTYKNADGQSFDPPWVKG